MINSEAAETIKSLETIIKSQSDLIIKKDEEIEILINHIKLLKAKHKNSVQEIMQRSLN